MTSDVATVCDATTTGFQKAQIVKRNSDEAPNLSLHVAAITIPGLKSVPVGNLLACRTSLG